MKITDEMVMEWGRDGVSLRDWFAGQAMRDTFAALAAAGWSNFNEYQLKRCAEASYAAADAMIETRAATLRSEIARLEKEASDGQ